MNKKIKALFEVMWNQQQFDLADELFAKQFVLYFPDTEITELEVYKDQVKLFFSGFPDLLHELDDVISEGNKVVVRWHGSGTHEGEYAGFAPTQNKLAYHGMTIFEVDADERITKAWVETDLMEALQRL